mmetsp:Transcript_2463/g.4345  ORF Transcript_2463/g.4345 Transcript_2463/m.4345 type:complete len:249 (-) Transcript_2463:1385-2131(-)|eukprot:CAMPEP_0182450262 /NCGR_PEP_ID=MMETSP1172-20130603/40081_1 /TAXON_ID=708627 /ORGANISM="Timspurckia oligopyrenoides, Strain CCMP3278" /LENGTH=248 /DNA_ID=CAMNT_0024647805 /DNA_START=126 /DNA_END=872 /DNA_ORIENTATION=+
MSNLNDQLNEFWAQQKEECNQVTEVKNHLLPLARIKKIMKSDEDVRMISAEAPVLFAKACEMFIVELTLRAWAQTEEAKRRTLQRSDISAAIQKTDIFDFLIDIVPREDPIKKDDPGAGSIAGGPPKGFPEGAVGPPGMQGVPYYANVGYPMQSSDNPAASMYGAPPAGGATGAPMYAPQGYSAVAPQGVYPGGIPSGNQQQQMRMPYYGYAPPPYGYNQEQQASAQQTQQGAAQPAQQTPQQPPAQQ